MCMALMVHLEEEGMVVSETVTSLIALGILPCLLIRWAGRR